MEFEATLLKADTPDSNGRVYSKEALKKAVEEYNKSHNSSTAVPEHKTRVKIDMESYHKNIPCGHIYDEYLADGSWAKGVQWYEYDVTPGELKDMIDKCVNVSSDFIIAWNDKFEEEVNKEMLNQIYKHDEDGERMYRIMQPYLYPVDVSNVIDMIKKQTSTKKYPIYIKGGGWYTGMEGNQRLPAQFIGTSEGTDFIDAVKHWADEHPGYESRFGNLSIHDGKAFLWGYELVATEEEATENGKYELKITK